MIDHSSDLITIIKSLMAKPSLDETERLSVYEKLFNLYKDNWRHSYSGITRALLQDYPASKTEALLDDLNQAVENLELIKIVSYKKAEEKELTIQDSGVKPYYACRRNIEKLLDHLNLEIVRIDYSKSLYRKLSAYNNWSKKMSAQLSEQATKVNELIEKVDSFNSEMKDQRNESITILGIFSSIVITFAGAFSLSASIFGNMDKISDARLFLITLFNVLFVVNILDYLFHFIKSIKQENPKYNWKRFFLVNIFLCIFGACVYSYFVHTQKTQITAPDTASETISSKIKTE